MSRAELPRERWLEGSDSWYCGLVQCLLKGSHHGNYSCIEEANHEGCINDRFDWTRVSGEASGMSEIGGGKWHESQGTSFYRHVGYRKRCGRSHWQQYSIQLLVLRARKKHKMHLHGLEPCPPVRNKKPWPIINLWRGLFRHRRMIRRNLRRKGVRYIHSLILVPLNLGRVLYRHSNISIGSWIPPAQDDPDRAHDLLPWPTRPHL